jgi:hypothetical protein
LFRNPILIRKTTIKTRIVEIVAAKVGVTRVFATRERRRRGKKGKGRRFVIAVD